MGQHYTKHATLLVHLIFTSFLWNVFLSFFLRITENIQVFRSNLYLLQGSYHPN